METTFLQQKFAAALTQVSVVLGFLRAMPGQPWVGYFERIESCLCAHDAEATVRARAAIPGPGMGGFGEFLEATPQIQLAYRELVDLVGDIKLHARYGICREHQVGRG